MSNQSNTSNDKPRTVQDIIREIEQKSKGGGYIYRGERKCNPKVSSKLYRDFEIEDEHFDIELVQKEMLAAAKKHTGDLPHDSRVDVMAPPNVIAALTGETEEAIDFEILTEIQHYGGKTNLIDFTTDYFIALFFACDGRYDEDGRVILQKIDEIRDMDMIKHPRNPRHRVIVQKSVFIRPPRGFIEPDENDIVTIPANLKQQLLQHLRDYHGISTEVIYNDLHGFIRNQNIHGDAYTHFHRGFACQNRADEAPTPEEKQQQYAESIKHYTEAIKLKPDLDVAYNNRGNAYAKKGELNNAIRDYNTAIKLKPNDAEAYYNRGNTYNEKGDFDNVINDYTEAIKLKPDYAEAYNNRGNAYAGKGDFNKAIEDYTMAIELSTEFAEAYFNRGNIYLKKDEVDNAIKDYTKVIQLKPDYAEAYYGSAVAYERKSEFDKAIQDYTKAIELKSDFPAAYGNRGSIYGKKGDYDSAIQDFTQAIQLKPDLSEAYCNRGVAYAGKGDFDKAIEDYTMAIELSTEFAEAYFNRGAAYANKGDFDSAIQDYTKAIQLKPDFPEAYCNRGEAWLHLQEWEKAKSDLITAQDLGMDLIAELHNDYANVEDFEQETGIQLPEDIAALLIPPQS